MKLKSLLFSAVLCLTIGSGLQAAIVDAPVPTNAYITHNGYDWAWAFPLPGADLSYQGALGWRIPTAAELLLAPTALDFLVAGGNVPFQGVDPVSGAYFAATNSDYNNSQSAAAVAVPYFSNSYSHADWQDGLGQTYGPWAGMQGAQGFADQLVIRDSASAGVPEPSAFVLMAGGVLSLVVRKYRKA